MNENPYRSEMLPAEIPDPPRPARRSKKFPFPFLILLLMIAGFLSLIGISPPMGRAMTPQESFRAFICWPLALGSFGAAVLSFVVWGVVRTVGLFKRVASDDPTASGQP